MRQHLEHIGDILRRDVSALRTLIANIYPPDLETKGLARAVRDLGIRQNRPPGLVRVEISGPLGQHPVTDRLIYRAVREALGNALRHAEASSVVIRIAQEEGRMTFEVVDDGVGFDPAAAGPEGHLGMRLISEMVAGRRRCARRGVGGRGGHSGPRRAALLTRHRDTPSFEMRAGRRAADTLFANPT